MRKGKVQELSSPGARRLDAEWRRVAAYVLCRDDDGRILLTRFIHAGHPDSGKWTMPGGAMEWGEDPLETAERELDEETGLRADIGRVLGVFSRWYAPDEAVSGSAGHVVGIVYEAANARGVLRTEFSNGAGNTTDGAGWFTLEEARTLPAVGLVAFCLDLCD
jgi:8-oxo-dGTP pyrophosphatase MutT (NUDIX family)